MGKIIFGSVQGFTGLKVPDIYKNFGFFIELNMTSTFFPFYTVTKNGSSSSLKDKMDVTSEYDSARELSSISLNMGINYLF